MEDIGDVWNIPTQLHTSPIALSLYLFSFEFYFSALPRTRPGTTCLAGDQAVATTLFSVAPRGKNQRGILSQYIDRAFAFLSRSVE